MAETNLSKIESFFEAWSGSLADLMAQLEAKPWQARANSPTQGYAALVSFSVKLAKGLQGSHRLGLSAADAALLLRVFLGEPTEISGELEPTQVEALTELLRQWAGLAATRLKPVFGEVSVELEAAPGDQPDAAVSQLLHGESEGGRLSVLLELDPGLLAQLDRRRRPRPELTPEGDAHDVNSLLRAGNLDLLLDVELGVTLRFGSRRAPLREVLELSPGAVLELNREIQEPVDLVLNERVIAQGDVVVIDGNYGLQITRVIAPAAAVS